MHEFRDWSFNLKTFDQNFVCVSELSQACNRLYPSHTPR